MDHSTDQFPFDRYLSALVKYLDTVKYCDNNYSRADRVATMRDVGSQTTKHFAQPVQVSALKVQPKKMAVAIRTSVQLVVFCWIALPAQAMVDLCIYFVYIIILDDCGDNPRTDMETFAQDLLHGQPQKGTFWRLMNDHLSSSFLPHYGSFCSLAILRSTLDYFQGCWIETYNFGGLPGSDCYPLFLRRLNGLGGICGGSLFPTATFNEDANFEQVTTVIAQIEPVIAFVNDAFSSYKEFGSPQDEINLITNECRVEGITFVQAFDRLTDRNISAVERLQTIFAPQESPEVARMINAFIEGYTTWHFCDERYRMREIYDRAGSSPDGIKFRSYYEAAMNAGSFDIEEWTSVVPTTAVSKQDANNSERTPTAVDEHRVQTEIEVKA